MQNPIVLESNLLQGQKDIEAFATEYQQSYNVKLDDPDYGSAFLYYVFFLHHPSVSDVLHMDIDENTRFYNAYYWFQRFVKMYIEKHGYDAGMEQQAFKMLENADFDLDLEIIDLIDKKSSE